MSWHGDSHAHLRKLSGSPLHIVRFFERAGLQARERHPAMGRRRVALEDPVLLGREARQLNERPESLIFTHTHTHPLPRAGQSGRYLLDLCPAPQEPSTSQTEWLHRNYASRRQEKSALQKASSKKNRQRNGGHFQAPCNCAVGGSVVRFCHKSATPIQGLVPDLNVLFGSRCYGN